MSSSVDQTTHAGSHRNLSSRRVVLIVTGGIAAFKSCVLVRDLKRSGCDVQVVMTESATKFVTPLTYTTLSGNRTLTDLFPEKDPIDPIHLQPAAWGELLVVAPATANFIGKLAHGIADDLASSSAIAFNGSFLLAPAMNSRMWNNEAVRENIKTLRRRGIEFIGPVEGEMGGTNEDSGIGRMSEPEDIVARISDLLYDEQLLKGRKVLVTSGPTREAIDPVRYISNRSSGKMGDAIAVKAAEMGADVTLIRGKGASAEQPEVGKLKIVESAQEMSEAVKAEFDACDILVMAAAVADWTVANPADTKLKKKNGHLNPDWKQTEDILAWAGKNKSSQIVIGFALETVNHEEEARNKLVSKMADLIILNDPTRTDSVFGGDTTSITMVNSSMKLGRHSGILKSEAAEIILTEAIGMLVQSD